MLSIEVKNSYSEVFELLKNVDRKDLEKIPMNLLQTIKNNRNKDYIPQIDFNNIQNTLTKKAISLYVWLYLEYITNDIEEKREINKILYENEIKMQNNLKINNNIFNKIECIENTQMMIYNENFLKKIINKIKEFFKLKGKK